MIERLTDPSAPGVDLIKYLATATGDARSEHERGQQCRPLDRRVSLGAEHWLLLYLAVRDSLEVPNGSMLEQAEGFGEMVDPHERFDGLYQEYVESGSPSDVAGTLAMLDMREAFARQAVIDTCGEPEYEETITTRQMDELGVIAGGVARRVCRAIAVDTATQTTSPA